MESKDERKAREYSDGVSDIAIPVVNATTVYRGDESALVKVLDFSFEPYCHAKRGGIGFQF